jgi:actin beta/gamma 1
MTTIVLDHGSTFIRAGFAGQDAPRVTLRNVVGQPKAGRGKHHHGQQDIFFGEQVLENEPALHVQYPVEFGVLSDFEALCHVWRHIFEEHLDIDCTQSRVFIITAPLQETSALEKIAESAFEYFNFSDCCIADSATLAIRATGRPSGALLKLGGRTTQATIVVDGSVVPSRSARTDIGGAHVDQYLKRNFSEIDGAIAARLIEKIKKEACYVAGDFKEALQDGARQPPRPYALPSGQTIKLDHERFVAPEVLLKPSWLDSAYSDIAVGLHREIATFDPEIQAQLYENIVLAGGSSLFPGMKERLHKELSMLVPADTVINLIAPENRQHLAWLEASRLACRPEHERHWTSRDDYHANKPLIVQTASLT